VGAGRRFRENDVILKEHTLDVPYGWGYVFKKAGGGKEKKPLLGDKKGK